MIEFVGYLPVWTRNNMYNLPLSHLMWCRDHSANTEKRNRFFPNVILKQIISWIESDINLWVDLNLFLFQKYFARNIQFCTTIAPTLTHVFIEKNLVFERDCANSSTELGVNLAAEREQVSLLKNVGVFQFYFVQMDRASGCFLTMSMKKLLAIFGA